jgi:hypothetical protein
MKLYSPVDWNDKESVIAYAKHLARTAVSDMVVFKHPSRSNYNITHAERTDRYEKAWVVLTIKPTREYSLQ